MGWSAFSGGRGLSQSVSASAESELAGVSPWGGSNGDAKSSEMD
jgi:hypothetical protein